MVLIYDSIYETYMICTKGSTPKKRPAMQKGIVASNPAAEICRAGFWASINNLRAYYGGGHGGLLEAQASSSVVSYSRAEIKNPRE